MNFFYFDMFQSWPSHFILFEFFFTTLGHGLNTSVLKYILNHEETTKDHTEIS